MANKSSGERYRYLWSQLSIHSRYWHITTKPQRMTDFQEAAPAIYILALGVEAFEQAFEQSDALLTQGYLNTYEIRNTPPPKKEFYMGKFVLA